MQRPMSQTIAFTVNGRAVNVVVAHDDTPLLDVLRNHLRLTGFLERFRLYPINPGQNLIRFARKIVAQTLKIFVG